MLAGVNLGEIEELRSELALFVAEVFASVARKDTRGWGDCYLRGLMVDGRRKSIQPMADRLPTAHCWRPCYERSPSVRRPRMSGTGASREPGNLMDWRT